MRGITSRMLALAGVTAAVLGCSSAATPSDQAPITTDTVTMAKSYRFVPEAATVRSGATVTWTNEDNFTHTVRLLSGAEWESGPVRPGESVTFTFTGSGEYRYECSLHPRDMTGVIVVAS